MPLVQRGRHTVCWQTHSRALRGRCGNGGVVHIGAYSLAGPSRPCLGERAGRRQSRETARRGDRRRPHAFHGNSGRQGAPATAFWNATRWRETMQASSQRALPVSVSGTCADARGAMVEVLAVRGLRRQVAKHPNISFEVSDVPSCTKLLADLPADNFRKDHLGRRFHCVQQYIRPPTMIGRVPPYCSHALSLTFAQLLGTMGPFPFASKCRACFASLTGWRARRDERDHFYGFGETTGELNKRGRKFRLSPKDAIGHDAGWGDPLYKQAASPCVRCNCAHSINRRCLRRSHSMCA